MRWFLGVVAVVAAVFTGAPGSGGWGAARSVPVRVQGGMGTYTEPDYLGASCSSSRDCTVAYQPPGKRSPVSSLTMRNGTWGEPLTVPGLRPVQVLDVRLACAAAGDCVLAVTVPADHGAREVMVARLAHGAWSKARPVPGLAALRPGQWSLVSALSCGRTGWCALAGQTEPPAKFGGGQPFVASEHNGTWSKAQAVPGLAGLTGDWAAGLDVMSCAGGACTGAGDYRDHAVHNDEPYAVADRDGRWGRARPIAGSASHGGSYIQALSCSAPGDCSAAGTEGPSDSGLPLQLFTVTEMGGSWHRAAPLRGTIPLPYSADTQQVSALTCAAPGQCTVLGAYGTSANSTDSVPVDMVPFAAAQAHGTWSAIRAIRGLPADAVAWVTSVSCASAGNCAAGGYYFTNANGDEYSLSSDHAFVVTEKRGTWGKALLVPGLAALGSKDSVVDQVACQPRHGCISIGDYYNGDRRLFTSAHR